MSDIIAFDNNVRHFVGVIDENLRKWYFNELNSQVNWKTIKWSTGNNLPRLCCHSIEDYEIGEILKTWIQNFFHTKLGVTCEIINIFGNKYRNGEDYLPDHRDDYEIPSVKINDNDITPNGKIGLHVVSLSFGATRLFRFKQNNQVVTPKFYLSDGDMIIFSPNQNKNYTHGIPKQKQITEERINLTCFCLFTGSDPYTEKYDKN